MKAKQGLLVIAALVLLLTGVAQGRQSSSVMDYVKQGSESFIKGDFRKAIEPYNKALDLEKKQASLDKTMWHVLIDNLGMAYGITGDLKKTKETFEYGLSKDDKYPMFYYNLACTYAEMNDLDNTIIQLKHAFEYRENSLVGESVPDPSKDDSFQRFMKNNRFLTALNDLKKGASQQAPNQAALQITEATDSYVMSVPVSRLIMTVPKGRLVRGDPAIGGGTASPRYFYLDDKASALVISGWFESDQGFAGIKQFWANESAAWQGGNLPQPTDVVFEEIGKWNAIVYDMAVPGGRNSNIRAHWIQAGTWIDIHLSLTSKASSAELRGQLREMIKSIQVVEKQ